MKRTIVLSVLAMVLSITCMFAQKQIVVSGTVLEKYSQTPAIGVNVVVKGTSQGTITDVDGNYSLTGVAENAVLVFRYVGMITQEVAVNGRSHINVQMDEDVQRLEETVVIGYGTSKAKDLTSPISVVKADVIQRSASSSPMGALQGKVAGVQITNNNIPGSSPEVKIRGVGSFTSTSPLYVVDGMFYDNIAFLNNNDVAEVSVLKDASAAAIYGVRAANGVIIITTRKGSLNQKATVTYDGYAGVQVATNKLKMANSAQYADILLEADEAAFKERFQKSIDLWGGDLSARQFNADTDWYDELLRNAFIQNHSLDVTGGNAQSTYSFGVNYMDQEGIMNVKNEYSRYNLRAKVDYQVEKWLKVGANMIMSNATQFSPNTSAWFSAFGTPSIIPVYDENRTDEVTPIKYASPSQVGLTNNFSNPVASAKYHNDKSQIFQILPSFYAEVNFLPENKLKFRTSYSADVSLNRNRAYTEKYYVSELQKNDESTLTKKQSFYQNWIWDNTLTYTDSFGKHGLTAMVGQSSREDNFREMWSTAKGVPGGEEEYLYISQGNEEGRTTGDGGTTYRGVSFFGRVAYDYAGKYLLSATFRADGSSKYQDKWGYFPSVGAAWVVSNENFMKNQKVFDYLKIRGSWGKLGNDKVSASDGFSSIATGNGNSGVFGPSTVPGYTMSSFFSWLGWEVVNETNVGFNFSTLRNRLNVDFDYYNRKTENTVIATQLPLGSGTLLRNCGVIENSGVELTLDWSDRIGKDFVYHVGANFTTLRNRVKDLSGQPYIYSGSAELRSISRVGDEMYSYYGYKVTGVYQNQAEIDACPIAKANGLEPGDFRYQDVNQDNVIDDADRQILGSNIPDFTYGFNVGFECKGWEFNMAMQGQAGNQIVNRKRQYRIFNAGLNYDEDFYNNRWQGEGTSNTYMSAKGSQKKWNIGLMNSFYVEDADYFRIQNIQLAYNFKNIKIKSATIPVRVSFTADRPFTCFKSNGFTPEVSSTGGWDDKIYPNAATYTLGLRITY